MAISKRGRFFWEAFACADAPPSKSEASAPVCAEGGFYPVLVHVILADRNTGSVHRQPDQALDIAHLVADEAGSAALHDHVWEAAGVVDLLNTT